MKKKGIVALAMMGLLLTIPAYSMGTAEAATTIEVNSTNFPDTVFRNYVLDNFDTSKDKKLSQTEINKATYISVDDMDGVPKNLDGIKYLTNLKTLDCSKYSKEMKLTTLDLSSNTNLEDLDMTSSTIKTLKLNSAKLKLLNANDSTQLTNFDLSKATALEELDLSHCSKITKLNLGSNTKLKVLGAYETSITAIDLSNNTALTEVELSYTKLKSITFGNCTKLTKVYLAGLEDMKILDLRKLTAMEYLQISRNDSLQFVFLPKLTKTLDLYEYSVPFSTFVDARECTCTVHDHVSDSNPGKTTAVFIKSNSQLGWFRASDYTSAQDDPEKYYWLEASTGTYPLQFHTGWLTVDGRTYYMNDNGELTFDAQKIDGSVYYFVRDREPYLGKLDPVTKEGVGTTTVVNPIDAKSGEYAYGQMVKGWFGYGKNPGKSIAMYFGTDGKMVSGWQKIDGKDYYFAPVKEYTFIMGAPKNYSLLSAISCGGSEDGWSTEISGKYYMINSDGTFFTGWWENANGEKFGYYGEDYAKMTGFFRIDGKLYYADELSHSYDYNKQFEVNGKYYRLNRDKSLCTGWYIHSYASVTDRYYYNENGELQTGFFRVDGNLYYAQAPNDAENIEGRVERTGTFTVGNDKYYANTDGTLRTGYVDTGSHTYVYDNDGKLQASKFIEKDGKKIHTDSSGIIQKGIFNIGNDEYYTDQDGYIQTGIIYRRAGYTDQTDTPFYYQEDGKLFKNTDWTDLYAVVEYKGKRYLVNNESGRINNTGMVRQLHKDGTTSSYSGTYYTNDKGEVQTGFITYKDNIYYFQKDGLLLTSDSYESFCEVDGMTLCVNSNGELRADGWFLFDYKYYYAYPTGEVYTQDGWFEVDDKTYYLANGGQRQSGDLEIDGKWYYFGGDETRAMKVNGWGRHTVKYSDSYSTSQAMYYGADGTMQTGWVRVDGEIYYFTPDEGKILKGLNEVDGNYYIFDSNTGMVKVRSNWYMESWITDEDTGERKAEYTYYFDEGGRRASGLTKVGDDYYLLTDKGQNLNKDIWHTTEDGKVYRFGEDGKALTGWQTVDEKKYYFNETGDMADGLTEIGGKTYLYVVTPGVTSEDPPTLEQKTGWQTIDNSTYYFKEDGAMAVGSVKIAGKDYYFGETGTTKGKMQTGWQTIGGVKYYFDKSGKKVTGEVTIDGKKYKFGTDGKLVGEVKPVTPATKKGWVKTGSSWYYYKNNKALTGWQTIDKKKYYFNSKGVLQTGWKKLSGKWYYFSKAAKTKGQMALGWQKIAKKWYYFSKSSKTLGEMTLGWKKIRKKWYHFSKSSKSLGEMSLGWKKLGKKWYHFSKSSKTLGEMTLGWKKLGGKWYYFSKSTKNRGAMITGWKKLNKKWYFFSKSSKKLGEMATGWKKIGKKWHYFVKNGVMVAGKSKKIGKKTYKFNKNGVCLNK